MESANTSVPVVIIGGGLCGLSCAGHLAELGIKSVIFDRGRFPGGRVASRAFGNGLEEILLDHGASRLRAVSPDMRSVVKGWVERGIARWISDHEIASTSSMRSIPQALARRIHTHQSVREMQVSRTGKNWEVLAELHGQARPVRVNTDQLIFACPWIQAERVLSNTGVAFPKGLRDAKYDCNWVYLGVFETRDTTTLGKVGELVNTECDHELINELRVSVINDQQFGLVAIMSGGSANERTNADAKEILIEMQEEIQSLDMFRESAHRTLYQHAHRWGIARANTLIKESHASDPEHGVLYAGDYFSGPDGQWRDAESAVLSGISAASALASRRDGPETNL